MSSLSHSRALRDGVDTGRVQEMAGGFGDAAYTRRAPRPLPFRAVEGLCSQPGLRGPWCGYAVTCANASKERVLGGWEVPARPGRLQESGRRRVVCVIPLAPGSGSGW